MNFYAQGSVALFLCYLCKGSKEFCRIDITKIFTVVVIVLPVSLYRHKAEGFIFIVMEILFSADN